METIIFALVAVEKWYYLKTGRAGRVLRAAWRAYGRKMQRKLNAEHGTDIPYLGMI